MKPIKILEEAKRHHWAMLPESLEAIRSFLEGYDLNAKDHELFHALDKETKISSADSFGSRVDGSFYTSIKGNTGFLQIDGPIIPRATWFSEISGMVSLDVLTAEFKSLEQNDAIKTIVLVVDSPGGVITGVSDFAALVKASSKRTETFAWMAASAAYEIVSATDKITTPDTGLVGSIGTVLMLTDTRQADAKKGIQQIEIVSSQSPNKRPDPLTEKGREVLQTLVNEIADVFVSNVASNRDVTVDTVLETFGAGAVFAAARAHKAGMIDSIMDLDTFIKSFGADTNSLRGFGLSATVVNNQEGDHVMSETIKTKTAEVLRNEQPDAVAEIVTAAKTEERERLKTIEAVVVKFDNALPTVKAKAVEYINANKYAVDATPETVALGLVDIIAKAQVAAVDDFGEERRTSANIAGGMSTAVPSEDDEAAEAAASEKRTIALCEARKAEQGEK